MKTSELLILFFFLTLLLLIFGLIKPKLVLFFVKTQTRGRVIIYYLTLTLLFFFTAGAYGLGEKEADKLNQKMVDLNLQIDSLNLKDQNASVEAVIHNEKEVTEKKNSPDLITQKINLNREKDDFKDPDDDGIFDYAKRQMIGSDWGEKVSFDDSDIYYSSSIAEDEAIKLRDYLTELKLISGQAASLHIRYNNRIDDAKFELRIVTNYSEIPDSSVLNMWKLYAAAISGKVFDHSKVTIHLCNDAFKTISIVSQ